MEPNELLKKLKEALGEEFVAQDTNTQEELNLEANKKLAEIEPKEIIDANELLDNDKNPLAEAKKVLKSLNSGEVIAIKSDFKPEPLIEEFVKDGYKVYCKEEDSNFLTYIQK